MPRLTRLSRAKDDDLPFAKATFYKWHHLNRHPGLFVKVGRTVFIDLDEMDRIFERAKENGKKRRR